MNKMGICQRFWCLIVTAVLLITAAEIYPGVRQTGVQADGRTEKVKPQVIQRAFPETASAAQAIGPVAAPQKAVLASATVPLKATQTKNTAAGASVSSKKRAAEKFSPASIAVSAPEPDQIIKSLKVTATGYTAGYESTGKTAKHPQYGITYSGVKVRRDKNTISTIAADPKVLPLGSILYIPDYGYAVVADTGSAIKGRKIDLYFATTKQVYREWGKKTVVVHLIKRGKGKCTEAMLKSLSRAIQTHKGMPPSSLEEVI